MSSRNKDKESSLWIMRHKENKETIPYEKNRGPNVDSDQQNMFSLSIMRMEKCTGENKYRVITTVRNPKKP